MKAGRPVRKNEAELLTDVILSVFRVNGSLLEAGDRLVEPLGLTSARWQVIGAIALAGEPQTAPQIGAAMGVTRQGVQKQLNSLMAGGLIEKRTNPRHERSVLYALSKKGKLIYSEAEKLQVEWSTELARGLSASALETARRVLYSLNNRLEVKRG